MTVADPPPAVAAAPPAPLAYAPAVRRRRAWRRAGLLVLLLAVAAAAWQWGPPYWRQARYLWWQHRCMACTRPADRVVYEEDAGRAGILLGRPAYGPACPAAAAYPDRRRRLPMPAGHTPPVWAENRAAWASAVLDPGGRYYAETVLFLHARRTPAGRPRLVVVNVFVANVFMTPPEVFLLALAGEPATWRPGSVARLKVEEAATAVVEADADLASGTFLEYTATTRFYAGQPDPADESHFTIAYEQNGRRGTIDGRLDDRDAVTLTFRDVPAWGRRP